eukprot:SAG22_NODE_2011_length_3142_cov_1.643115_1_plen_415_part_00
MYAGTDVPSAAKGVPIWKSDDEVTAATGYTQRYDNHGAYDWLTGEAAPFEWGGRLFLMESIMCGCSVTSFSSGCDHYEYYPGHDHAGFPKQSYLRIRELDGGAVVANLPESGSYAFGSALADAPSGRVWVFGTPYNRCNSTTSKGCDIDPSTGKRRPCFVAAWWSSDPALERWTFAGPILHLDRPVWNTAVAKVEGAPAGPPTSKPLHYVMVLETLGPTAAGLLNMTFAGNPNTARSGGDLSTGWAILPHDIRDEAALGNRTKHTLGVCPFIRQPAGSKYYYVGTWCNLLRSTDLSTWEVADPAASPTEFTVCKPNLTADVQLNPLNRRGLTAVLRAHEEPRSFLSAPQLWDSVASDVDVTEYTDAAGNRGTLVIYDVNNQGMPVGGGLPGYAWFMVTATSPLPLGEWLQSFFE